MVDLIKKLYLCILENEINMKKLFALSLLLLSVTAFSQEKKSLASGFLNRFTDPGKGHVAFIEKGSRSFGFNGGYRNFIVGGNNLGDGYSILSFLNIGNGRLHIYNFSPKFGYFVADDLALGVKLDYSGYTLDSDLNLSIGELGNLEILNRHMHNNSWGGSVYMDKYLSVFGSKTFGFVGELQLYGRYTNTMSCPIIDTEEYKDENGVIQERPITSYRDLKNQRVSSGFSVGLHVNVGAMARLRDGSSLQILIPIVGVAYSQTNQKKYSDGNMSNQGYISQFNVLRKIDFLGIQIGYVRYIKPKKR